MKITQSKRLYLYVELLEDDHTSIDYEEIASRYPSKSANTFRAMMNQLRNTTRTFLGLVNDLGKDPDEIPRWVCRPKRFLVSKKKRRIKRVLVRR